MRLTWNEHPHRCEPHHIPRIRNPAPDAGAFWDETRRLLVDFQDRRLAGMDANGIELAILGLNSPALQAILDPAEAVELARRANDTLANEIAQNPHRFAGFAGLPMQDPDAAARELTRCITELGFKGAMCNCFTQRHVSVSAIYYDLPEFRPFWATVVKLDVPFYLHPRRAISGRGHQFAGHNLSHNHAMTGNAGRIASHNLTNTGHNALAAHNQLNGARNQWAHFPSDLSAFLKLPAVSPRERQRFQWLSFLQTVRVPSVSRLASMDSSAKGSVTTFVVGGLDIPLHQPIRG